MTQPNWLIVVVISAIAGYLLPHLIRSLQYIIRRFRQTTIEGTWHVYHITNVNNESRLVTNEWNIRKGYTSPYVITSYTKRENEIKNAVYKGKIAFERNYWIVRTTAIDHKEEVSFRLLDPIPGSNIRTWGLFLALDFHGVPVAGPVLISKNELSHEEATDLLVQKTRVNNKHKLLTTVI